MKFRIVLVVIILFSAVLSGCASGPTFQEYSSNIPESSSETGRIYIYRKSIMGAAVQPKVKVNGEVVGKAVPKGFFVVNRPAGSYEISASTEAKRSLTLNIEPGDEKYVRLEMKIGFAAGHVKPVLVENTVGKKEIAKTKYIGD